MKWLLVILSGALIVLPLLAQQAPRLQFRGGWMYSADSGAVTGAFLTIVNPSNAPDTIVAVRSACAEHAEIHTTIRNSDGTMGMRPIAELVIPAHATVQLRPRSLHLMLYHVQRTLRNGDRCTVFLESKRSGTYQLELVVRR